MLKQCGMCKRYKELIDFNKEKAQKDGLARKCRACNSKLVKRHYVQNIVKYRRMTRERNRISLEKRHEYVNNIKKQGCVICGENEPICIDFHHKDPSQKDTFVSKLSRRQYRFGRLEEEIKKCVLLCANCHRKFHAGLIKLPENTEELKIAA